MWRQRFLAHGLEGLKDAKRPGKPPTYRAEDRLEIVALATSVRDPDEPEAVWTCQAASSTIVSLLESNRPCFNALLPGKSNGRTGNASGRLETGWFPRRYLRPRQYSVILSTSTQ
ncbi:MAG: helix-turn-helix domain-containing protein [Actinomycetota bacterium]